LTPVDESNVAIVYFKQIEVIEGPIRRTTKGGSEWEPIKILLEGDENSNQTNTASKSRLEHNYQSWPRPRSHWRATDSRNQQPPSRTRDAAELATLALLTYTGLAGEHHRSDRSLLAKPGNFHKRPLHWSGWCSSLVRPVQVRKPQLHQTGLPSSKLTQTRNNRNTGQQRTQPDVHPRQNPQSLCTGQPCELHRSDRSGWIDRE
jgi:hypothetical protein